MTELENEVVLGKLGEMVEKVKFFFVPEVLAVDRCWLFAFVHRRVHYREVAPPQ